MGQVKHQQQEQEDKFEIAKIIAYKADILAKCEIHGEYFNIQTDDYEKAYRIGNKLITDNEDLVSIFNGNRSELIDMIQDIRDEISDECNICMHERYKQDKEDRRFKV